MTARSIVCAILLAASCTAQRERSAQAPSPYEVAEPVASDGALLPQLRANRDFVRSAPSDVGATKWGPTDVSRLVHVKRAEVEGQLGPPDAAGQDGVVYYFYRLPPGAIGGGPELEISYSADGRCSKAVWMLTQ